MMIKSGYQEGLYYQQGFPAPTEALEEQLRALLRENHGVGILGGSYSYGATVDLFNGVINLVLLAVFNGISRRVSEISLW